MIKMVNGRIRIAYIVFALLILISCDKNDSQNEQSIPETKTGTIQGHVYYAGTTIPVSGVLITVGEKFATTQSDGYYSVEPKSGNHTLSATKDGFDNFHSTVEIKEKEVLTYTFEVTSGVFTNNLSGQISNSYNGEPISLVTITILNPDNSESNLKTQSSSTGYYQIPTVPQGNRTVVFSHDNCYSLSVDIFIANSGNNYDADLDIWNIPCPDEPSLLYEGHLYNTVLIGQQCWLKENINIGIEGSPEDNGIVEKYCNDCATYGGLYSWDEMMKYNNQNSQGICPSGWHIPSNNDWNSLEIFLERGISLQGLKAVNSLWEHADYNTNETGFTALPAGWKTNGFHSEGDYCFLWSSNEFGESSAYRFVLDNWGDGLDYNYPTNKNYGLSVRCIKNN